MQKYDISLKRFLEIGKKEIVNFILNREVEIEEEIEPSEIIEREATLPMLEREADAILRLRVKDEVFILHLEFEYEYKKDFELRMFEYLTRIYLREEIPVYSVAIFLKKRKKPIPDEIRIEVFGEEFLKFKYKTIKLWEIDGDEILDNKEITMYPFLPLTKLKEPEKAITKASEGILEIKEKKEDYFSILSVMTGLYYPNIAKKLLKRRDLVLKSIVYDEIKKEGIEEGRREGIEIGIEKGRREGKLERLKKDVVSVLRARFNKVPRRVTAKIKNIRGYTKLEHLLKLAAISKDLDEFEKNLE